MSEAPHDPPPVPTTETAPEPRPPRRWPLLSLGLAAAALVGFVIALALAPALLPLLPWGASARQRGPDAALATKVAALEAAEAQNRQTAAAVPHLEQRLAAVEARPVADLGPVQQQVSALANAVADAGRRLDAAEKDVRAARASNPEAVGFVLTLLQIREAIDIGRPFAAEYEALIALLHDRVDLAAAAAPLAEPAASGVASRAVLVERLRQQAPQIATATAPASNDSWRSEIAAGLHALVRIRRIEGAGQTPAEAAVTAAQHALAAGDLGGAVDVLAGLSGPAGIAAKPWLDMARRRLAVETTLRQLQSLAEARLGNSALDVSR